ILCKIVLVNLQYFFIVSHIWMMLEGVDLLMTVHNNLRHKNPNTSVYIAFGWVMPLCIVGCTFLIDSPINSTNDLCCLEVWITWAFVTSALVTIAVNSCILFIVIRIFLGLQKIKRQQIR
ncbi:adhesion G-protein coupled receptor D1-like, partial [Anneissia japonica]|uniref:adhesion G-protein coupled receptor D1-like n=1 Tax=Anneissia japonica TaxID=1529436 RepID=UPI001425792D